MASAIYLPETRDDLATAYDWYEARSAGLGDKFLAAISRAVGLIEFNPAMYGEVAPGVRACPTRRFPFVIYYRTDGAQVTVVAVRRGRDDPAIWQGRV